MSTPASPQASTEALAVTAGFTAPGVPAERPTGPPRPAADRFMRRLLRVGGDADACDILGAQRAMTGSILVSAVRCTITYLLVPVLAPIVGVLDLVAAPLSLVLCSLAFFMSGRSLRRFWRADHGKRWHYTTLVVVVWSFLVVAVTRDLTQIF